MRARTGLALVACGLVSCGQSRPAPPPQQVKLAGGDVARVGSVTLGSDLVADVAAARGLTPRAALDALIADALAEQGAQAEGLDHRPDVEWAATAATSRLLVKRLRDDARAAGPPTDAEVAKLSEVHWKDVAVPEQLRVVHAVVVVAKGADKAAWATALPIAQEVQKAVASTTTPEAFDAAAKQVDHPGFDVRVELIPVFIADGRFSEQGVEGGVDKSFASAAFALAGPGATSGVVQTPFGWHVIRVLEHLPPRTVPLEERRAGFAEETFAMRARAAHDAVIAARRAKAKVELALAADAILAELPAPER